MEGITRIKEMAKGQKDPILLAIVQYLISREDMDYNYLNEEKNLKEMAAYIEGQILKEYCKKMNIKNPSSHAKEIKYDGTSVRCLAVGMSEERTYELAINYFSKSNEELGIKSEEKKENNTEENNNLKIKDDIDEFGSIFDCNDQNETIVVEKNETKKEPIEQISLFSF